MSTSDDTAGDPQSLGIIESFERAWESSRPDVATHWERHPSRPPRLLLELAAIDLANRLARGEEATAEEYASRFPTLAADATLTLELRRLAGQVAGRRASDANATVPPTPGTVPPANAALPPPHTPAASSPAASAGPSFAAMTSHSTSDTLLGTVIGGVSIVRIIADGGMGRVYEGRQDKPRRPVAVKVIKPGIASPNMLKRFEYEAQVLGRLRHPGIAQIYSVGTHQVRGQEVPYFVMEYIPNAKSLTQYANEQKLSTQERLELFRKVCEAVAHGHQKGVIHRDLKPGNVLVDSSGQPKVIDFGVARSTDSDMALTTMQTDVGALIGTLQYMSPEQFDADPNDLDVRLDVYALGVILYELLAGKPPYEVRQRAIHEVARIVREDEPTALSILNKSLRRDVGVIAGKCLQKDRGRRYSSATELAGDVSRYLAGEPITAAPPSFWDSMARVARRHKAAATAVAVIAASLVAAVVGISAFAVRAERARKTAEQAQVAEHQMRSVAETARQAAESATTVAQQEREAADGARQTAERERTAADEARRQAEWQADKARRALMLAERSAEHELEQVAEGIIRQAADPPALAGGSDLTSKFLDARRVLVAEGKSSFLVDTILPWCFDRHPLPLATYRGHRGKVYTAVVSPDGLLAATGSIDGDVRLWNIATGETLATLSARTRHHSLAFSPSGKQLLTSHGEGLVTVWNVPSGDKAREWKAHESLVFDGAFTPDGSRIITAEGALRVWDVATGEKVLDVEDCGSGLALTERGDRVAAIHGSGLTIVDLATGKHRRAPLSFPSEAQSITWSPHDTHLLVGIRGGVAIVHGDGSAVVSVAQGSTREKIFDIRSARDGRHVATCGVGKTVETWNWRYDPGGVPSLVLDRVCRGHAETVVGVDWVPGASRLVSASLDGTAKVWAADEAPATTRLRPLAGVTAGEDAGAVWCDDVLPLAIGRYADAHDDGYGPGLLVCFDTQTGRSLARLDLSKLAADTPAPATSSMEDVRTLSFASGAAVGSVWVIAAARLHRWNLLDGTVEPLLPIPESAVVAFSPASDRLAIGTDTSCEIWDLAARQRLAIEPLPSFGLCFSPDGSEIVRLDAEQRLRFHAADTLAVKDRNIQLDFGPRFTEASDQVSISWRGDCLMVSAGLWVAPTFVDMRTAAVRRMTADRVTYDETGLSEDGEWMFGRNSDTLEIEIWEVASLKRAWSFTAAVWAACGDKFCFCIQEGSVMRVFDLAALQGFLGFQRGVSDGRTFAANSSRPTQELVELGRYYGLCRQPDLAAMLLGAAEARGESPSAAAMAEAFDAAGEGPRAVAAYERAAGGELPEWFCRLCARAPREAVSAAPVRDKMTDFLKLAIDVHESRGDGLAAIAAIEQAAKAGVLSAADAAERRVAVEAAIARGQTVIPWKDAAGSVGRRATVEGRVVQTGNIGRICFLNFDADRSFTVTVFPECFAAWPQPPEDWFKGKIVRVSGWITTHKRKPQIEVNDPSQITVVEVAEAAPVEEAPPLVPWEDAAGSVDKQATVVGRVVDAKNIGAICFLNFDADRSFTVPVFKECFAAWPEPPEERFRDQTVRVTGKIKLHKGKPQIEVHDASRIEIVDATEAETISQDAPAIINWENAAGSVGRRATIEGRVVRTGNIGRICFLNFDADRSFTVPVFKECFAAWPERPEDRFRERTVRVTGQITLHKGKPQIEVHDANQIVIVDANGVAGVVATGPVSAPSRQPALELTPEAAADHLDRVATVTGTIAEVATEAGERRLRLDAGAGLGFLVRVLPEANPLVIAGSDPFRPGRPVSVVGRIVRIGELPGVVVHDASQLQLRSPTPTGDGAGVAAPQTKSNASPPAAVP
jgi:WD40 repeat protein/DNA/RNA endonuclease YhcR with UshA esterase domain/tRNA A-37 threonylcarbamoyl transferase component Bud32